MRAVRLAVGISRRIEMATSERSLLLESHIVKLKNTGLSVALATACIVDVFGVFPLVTLPKAIIQCGKLSEVFFISAH